MNAISNQIQHIGLDIDKINAIFDKTMSEKIIKSMRQNQERINEKINTVKNVCYISGFLDNELIKIEFKDMELSTLHALGPIEESINGRIQNLQESINIKIQSHEGKKIMS